MTTVKELVDGGDWACSEGDAEALSRICAHLAARLTDLELARAASRVAAHAVKDVDRATGEWGVLSRVLHGRADL